MVRQFVASEEFDGVRIGKCPAEAFAELSRSYLQKLLRLECALVNGELIKSNYRVNASDSAELEAPEVMEPEIMPEKMDLDIVYEDEDIVTVDKPKGMMVHPAVGYYSGALVNGLMEHCKDELSGINGAVWSGIVHRIDMDTTGLLIVRKNNKAHNEIAGQLREHPTTRRYQAIVHGMVEENEGMVDAPIGRHPMDREKMSVSEKNGWEAVTHYRVLERFCQFTYIECRLETGRTHRIWVHMASIHHPLLGDVIYGPTKCPCEFQGQAFHAGVLGFAHPEAGEYMGFEAPLPGYFEELLEKLRDS